MGITYQVVHFVRVCQEYQSFQGVLRDQESLYHLGVLGVLLDLDYLRDQENLEVPVNLWHLIDPAILRDLGVPAVQGYQEHLKRTNNKFYIAIP